MASFRPAVRAMTRPKPFPWQMWWPCSIKAKFNKSIDPTRLDGVSEEARPLGVQLWDREPAMIEEATRNAREVAARFAQDSDSTLGKIRTASQGLFTIQDRDSNTPQIKKVRVVSTVEYYLVD